MSIASVFSGAFLLFLVEPMVAKMALPRFGGSPAVWNMCMLLFQALLLAGYGYSHLLGRRLVPRRQVAVHGVLLIASLAALPPVLREVGDPTVHPAPALLFAAASAAGVPFFLLASHSSLAQRWFSLRTGREPYFLYGASNVGALAALVAYPLLIEPYLGARCQGHLWSVGYGVFLVLVAGVLASAWKSPLPSVTGVAVGAGWTQRGRWLFRSTTGSCLLLAISLRITTDVASLPLLWVAPLALYLATFVLAFSPRIPYPRRWLEMLVVCGVTVGLGSTPMANSPSLWQALGLPLATLFAGCWVCHADLVRDRPPVEHLTEFYAWIAVGGLLGGVLCNLVAPLIFDSVAEFPIALLLLAVALAFGEDGGTSLRRALGRPITFAAPAAMAAALGVWAWQIGGDPTAAHASWNLIPLLVLVAGMALWRVPAQFCLASALVAGVSLGGLYTSGRVLAARRSFFGVLRVMQLGDGRVMVHGTTVHGAQITNPLRREPATYYHPDGPMGTVVAEQRDGARIAVVGLGSGSLAALLRPGQKMTFFELDPTVEPMARAWFTFLGESRGEVAVVAGDARLTLPREAGSAFDLLVLDAFTGDAVPVHLLTVEAFNLYLGKVKTGGLLLLHISNRHLDLARVVRGASARLGLATVRKRFGPTARQLAEGALESDVVAVARSRTDLAALEREGWRRLDDGEAVTWTDDRSSLIGLLRLPE
ncbi:MAG: hypothetical protein EXR72_01135 [Myxococcales bacterium]|nr:hypothetical protein [Myxococcales bacterium]